MTKPSGPGSKTNSWTDDHCAVDGAHAFVLRVSSFFGMAPLKFQPHGNGYIVSISIPMCIYSYILGSVLVALTIFGLISELKLGISPYVHMTSQLSQIISCIDISIVTIMASVGVYAAPRRMRSMIKFMNIIASVNKKIGYQYAWRWERRLSAGFCLIMLCFTVILIDEMWYFAVKASVVNRHWDLVIHYLGFYVLWFVIMLLKTQFTVTVMVVYSRFRAVKKALSATSKILTETYIEKEKDPDANNFMTQSPSDGSRSEKTKAAYVRRTVTGDPRQHRPPSDVIERISSLHVELCDVVHLLENSYSTVIVIMLILNMFHLIVSPYFAILGIQTNTTQDSWTHFAILQCAWYIIHTLKLLLIVEPCYYTIAEVSQIENLVCRMIVTAPTTGLLASRLEHLALQMMMQPINFKPKGLCTLDRPLIASIFGAVTTYLVILIQFQKYEN